MDFFQLLFLFATLLVLVLFVYIYLFNKLQKNKQKVEEARSMIDTQLKRRYDLIPNLVETVKGYSSHESKTLENIVNLRTNLNNETHMEKKGELDNTLQGVIRELFVSIENYPDLKANKNFLDLQENLVGIEDSIQYARRYYNGAVREYNNLISTFPGNLLKFANDAKKEEYFFANEEERKNTVVKT